MKKLILLSAILGLNLATATNLNLDLGIGTGYIDDKKKDVIVKLEQNVNQYFTFGGKFADNYLKGYISTIPVFISNSILLNGAIGAEKYKISKKDEIQAFLKYRTLLITKQNINPKAYIEIGTKSVNAGAGVFFNINKKWNAECEISKRWLYKRIENKKNTTSGAIYINYSF